MINYFLDTNTAIIFLRGKSLRLREKILLHPKSQIKISAVVKAELLTGAFKSRHPHEQFEIVMNFIAPFQVIAFCGFCAEAYAKIRFDLEKDGKVIGPYDMQIAATALLHEGILVTENTAEFNRIKELRIENWTR